MVGLHKIKAWLYDNILNSDNPGDLVARVAPVATLGVNDISHRAVSQSMSGISEEVMAYAVGLWLREMATCLCEGSTVDADGYFTASLCMKGTFNGMEKFNPEKHTLWCDFRQGVYLRRKLEATEVEIAGMATPQPGIVKVIDVKTGSVNDLVTPNHPFRICGNRLKIAGSESANGVCFVCNATGQRIRVPGADLLFNKPGELIVMVPRLPEGSYTVEITTRYGTDNMVLPESHTITFGPVYSAVIPTVAHRFSADKSIKPINSL